MGSNNSQSSESYFNLVNKWEDILASDTDSSKTPYEIYILSLRVNKGEAMAVDNKLTQKQLSILASMTKEVYEYSEPVVTEHCSKFNTWMPRENEEIGRDKEELIEEIEALTERVKKGRMLCSELIKNYKVRSEAIDNSDWSWQSPKFTLPPKGTLGKWFKALGQLETTLRNCKWALYLIEAECEREFKMSQDDEGAFRYPSIVPALTEKDLEEMCK